MTRKRVQQPPKNCVRGRRGGRRGGNIEPPASTQPSSPDESTGEVTGREQSRSPSPSRSRASSNASRASSVASIAASSVASSSSLSTQVRKKRARKTQFRLDEHDEQLMCDFLRVNTLLWDIKMSDYRKTDKKTKIWEDQAKSMDKTVQHLQGWFKSLRDTHTRIHKKKSGDGTAELTEREQWVMTNFGFLQTAIRHRAEPVRSVKATIAAHSGDLEAAEAACAEMVDDDTTPSPIPATSSRRKGKGSQGDDQLLHALQQRVDESGKLLKDLAQPKAMTATAAFANYVHDSLVSMSKHTFKKARARINTILTDLMDEESDEEAPHKEPAVTVPVNVRQTSATATYLPTASEMYQPPPHMWIHRAPAASVWGSQTADYVNQYMQQPLQYQQMVPPTTKPGFQSPPQVSQPTCTSSVSDILGSAAKILNQSPSAVDSSNQSLGNISGLSGVLNMSGSLGATSSPYSELNTPTPPTQK